jgi:hypothetical protein
MLISRYQDSATITSIPAHVIKPGAAPVATDVVAIGHVHT